MALGPGSIAFVGFNADGNDGFAFVAIDGIPTGTVIHFNDNEWNGQPIGAGGAFNSGEGSLTWTNGGEAMGLIPTRYPGSATSAASGLALSRQTDWQDLGPLWSLPLGQRMLVTDTDEIALMDIRHLSALPSASNTD